MRTCNLKHQDPEVEGTKSPLRQHWGFLGSGFPLERTRTTGQCPWDHPQEFLVGERGFQLGAQRSGPESPSAYIIDCSVLLERSERPTFWNISPLFFLVSWACCFHWVGALTFFLTLHFLQSRADIKIIIQRVWLLPLFVMANIRKHEKWNLFLGSQLLLFFSTSKFKGSHSWNRLCDSLRISS